MPSVAKAVFNAAKETALDGFIDGHLGFTRMAEVVDEVLNTSDPSHIDAQMTLDNVTQTDHLARTWADEAMAQRARNGA